MARFLPNSNIHLVGEIPQEYPEKQHVFHSSLDSIPPCGSVYYWTITDGKKIYISKICRPPADRLYYWSITVE